MFVKTMDDVRQPEIIRKALTMLELMDRSAEDKVIIHQVSSMLDDYDERKTETEQLLCGLISLLLGSFAMHLPDDDILSTHIKLLQIRMSAPVSYSENLALQHYVEVCADLITQKNQLSPAIIQATLEPLFRSFGLDTKKSFDNTPASSDAKPEAQTTINSGLNNEKTPELKSEARFDEKKEKTVMKAESSLLSSLRDKESNANNNTSGKEPVYDNNSQTSWDMNVSEFGKSLKQLFSNNYLANSIAQSEKFGALLEVELAALKHLNDIDSFENKKTVVLNELEKVLLSHQEMTQHFQKMSEFISVVQKDSLRLNEELDRVTSLSLTDELTDLPNRRAFLRRLKDEVGRVKRYGHHLSLALIDLDFFKPINDKYGHAVGDAVLKAYASDILSGFREQDLVARIGGEEFVVIFPDTAIPGALQALNVVQEHTQNVVLSVNEENVKLPTFSAGLISYQLGESTDTFIQRADQALYDAKNKGRNRIEVKFLQENIIVKHES